MGCIQSSSKSIHSPNMSSPAARSPATSPLTSQEYSHRLHGTQSDFDNLGSMMDLRTLQQEVKSLLGQMQLLPSEIQDTLQHAQANLEQLSTDLTRRTQHFDGESSLLFRQRYDTIRFDKRLNSLSHNKTNA